MHRYIEYFEYYLEFLAKRFSGRGNMDPKTNGEFSVMESIVKNSSEPIFFLDGGANIGIHSEHFIFLCNKFNKKGSFLAIEPFENSRKVLEKKIPDCKHLIIPFALGEKKKIIDFFVNNFNDTCASNSTLNHYYLNHKIKVNQITLDSLIATKKIKKINFLKLDVEGAEYQCLLGAKESLRKGIIEYIQLEYDQTWLEAGGSIKKILGLCKEFGYKLYRIDSKRLLSISKYNFNLDDFSYSNLLMVKNGSRLPLPCNREAIPLTI